MAPHTVSIVFWHLSPNSARIDYATEGAFFTAVQCPRTHVNRRRIHPRFKKKFCLDSNDFGFICAGVSNVVSYIKETSDIVVVCYKLTVI